MCPLYLLYKPVAIAYSHTRLLFGNNLERSETTMKNLTIPRDLTVCCSLLFFCGSIMSCANRKDQPPLPRLVVVEVESPADAPSGESNLTVGRDGAIYMSWVSGEAETGYELRFSKRAQNDWEGALTVASGTDWFVNWADFPALAVNADGIALNSWLRKSSSETFSYDIRLALADDTLSGWGDPFSPHSDGTKTEHGFVSLQALVNGSFAALWLDGRQSVDRGPMSLRYCEVNTTGEISAEAVLDTRVCDCCQTSLAQTASGVLIAAYRDRSDAEIRDISIVRFADGKWSAPETIHRDNWFMPGCPVNGPALAVSGPNVAIAWFTRDSVEALVYVAFSEDDGLSFSQTIRVDVGTPEGRVDLAFIDNQTALVSWLELGADSAALYVRPVSVDGRTGDATLVAHTSSSRASGFAHLAVNESEMLISWTDTAEPARVRVARVKIL